MQLSAEVTVEPFVAGRRGPHVEAVGSAARRCGALVEVGPFGDRIEGDEGVLSEAMAAAVRDAFAAGATRLTVQVTAVVATAGAPSADISLNRG